MYCTNCGKEIPASAAACPSCGQTPGAGKTEIYSPPGLDGGSAPVYTPPIPASGGQAMPPAYGTPPNPQRKKRNLIIGLVAGGAALLVLLGILVVILASRGNPKNAVLSALAASCLSVSEELEKTEERLGLGAFDMLRDGPAKMEIDMAMAVPEESYLGMERVNLNMSVLSDLPGRRMEMSFGVGMAGTSLVSGILSLDDDLLILEMPDLYQGSYGVHTATLGADFNKSNLRGLMDASKIDDDLSFNCFDWTDLARADAETFSPEEMEILATMWEAAEVESVGRKTESVNGYNRECSVYTVVVPQAAARTFLQNLADYLEASNEDMNELGGMLREYGLIASNNYTSDSIYRLEEMATDLSGDVEATVFVHNGEAVALNAVVPMRENYAIRAELGGENNLSDAFFLEVANEYDPLLRISAEGNHTMQDGVFSTTVTAQSFDDYEGELADILDIRVKYDSNAALDNFEATLEFLNLDYYENVRIYADGTVDVSEDGVSYDFYNTTIESGDETVDTSLLITLSPAEASDFRQQDPTLILDMKLMELTELGEEIEENGTALMMRWMSLIR